MRALLPFLSFLLSPVAVAELRDDQTPLSQPGDKFDLIAELKKAEIIPTVFDQFQPFLTVSVSWNKAAADVGNTVKPKKVHKAPNVSLQDRLPDLTIANPVGRHPQLTLVLTDPDARSREDPDWSEMCHWIATDVPLTGVDDMHSNSSKMKEIMSYKSPDPPKKTGKHRYVFAALSPKNGTYDRLNLTVPAERQHWGFGQARRGLREWADENGLAVIGANFIYAQHKKQ